MNGSKDRLLIIKKYRSLSPEARKLVNTETNDRFWTKNEDRRNQKLDLNNPADKPFVKEWLQIRDELVSLKDYDWENIASKNREIQQFQQEQGKTIHIDDKTYQPAWNFQDRAKREILGRIDEKIDKAKIDRKTTEEVSFHTPSVSSMSVVQLGQLEKSIDNLLTARKVAAYKDLDIHNLVKTDIYSKIEKSLDSGKIPNYQPITEIMNIVKPVLDPATLKALDTTFDQYRQYPKNWGILTTRSKVAIGEEKSSDADLVKEAKSGVSKLRVSGIDKFHYDFDEYLGTKNPITYHIQKRVEKFSDDLLQKVRSPNPDTYRYIQKLFDELASKDLDDLVAAAFLRKNGGATDKDLAIMAKSPHGGKELLVRLYDVLTTKNLWAGDKERYAAMKVLMTVATLQESPRSRVKIFPFSSTFLSGAYVTAKMTKEGNIWVKMNPHIRGDYPDAKLLGDKLFTTGITLKPWETIGIQRAEQGSKSVQWGPALLLLNMQKHSRDALFGNYFTSAMVALTIATLGMSGAAVEATAAKESLTTGAKVLETARKVGTIAVEVADGWALGTFGVGLITRESSNWLIDTFGKDGELLVEAVKEAEKTAAVYGVARLSTGGIKYGWNKIKKSLAYKQLKAEDLKKAKEFEENINQIEIEFNKARTEATGTSNPERATPKKEIVDVPLEKVSIDVPEKPPKTLGDIPPSEAPKGSKELIEGGHAGTASLKGDGGQTGHLIFNIKELEKTILEIEALRIKPQDKPLRRVRPADLNGSALKARGEETVKIASSKGSRDLAIEGGHSITTPLEGEIGLIIEKNFANSQIKNWKSDHFWKTPEELLNMRGRKGFHVVIDKNTNEVIGAYFDYSGSSLTTGARAENFNKLFESKFDMVVRPDFRRRGIGEAIFQEMIKIAKENRAEHIKVHASNPGSFRWFRRYHPKKIIVDNLGKPPTTTEKPPKPPGDFPPSEMTREGPVAQKGELSTMRGELLIKSDPLKDLLKPRPLKHTDYPGKTPTPTELQKMEANLSKMDLSKEGLVLNDRPHLWKDPKHCKDFLKSMGKPDKFDEISSLPKEMQHQSYNKFIQDSAKDALKKSDTFMYECDYHNLNGDFGGHQVNVEFSSPTGKRIIVSFDKESGQIFNTFDIKRSGEPIGKGKTMEHPTFTFRNREWIKGNDKQWLGSRSEKPFDVVEKKRVDKPQIPAQTEKPEAKLKIRERKDQQKIAERVDQMGSRFG